MFLKFNILIVFIGFFYSSIAVNLDNVFPPNSIIKNTQSDTTRIQELYNLGNKLYKIKNLEAQSYFEKGLKLINDIQNPSESFQKQKIAFLSRLGSIEKEKGNFDKAIDYYSKAETLSYKVKDTFLVSEIKHNFGTVFYYRKNYNKALSYLKYALEIKKHYTDTLSLATTYELIGIQYRNLKELDSTLFYYNKAKQLYEATGNQKELSSMKGNMAVIYFINKDYDKSIALWKEHLTFQEKQGNYESICNAYYNLSVVYKKKGDLTKALSCINKSLNIAKKQGFKRRIMKAYKERSFIYSRLKDYKNAFEDSKMYKRYSDSMFNSETNERIHELEMDHKLDIQNIENAQKLKLEKEKTQTENKHKKLYFTLFLMTLLAALLTFLLIKRSNEKKLLELKIAKKKIEQELTQKEHHLKDVVINNKLRQQIQKQVLNEVKSIIKLKDETARKAALKSLSVSILSHLSSQETSLNIQDYLEQINQDFKDILDTKYPILNDNEKTILCFMELGLNTNDIKTIQNTTLASVKSARSRIRKKLELKSTDDIIKHIKSNN